MAKELYSAQIRSMMGFDGDTNYCVPVALALVSGKTAAEVNTSLMAKGRRKKGHGVCPSAWKQELNDMGVGFTNVTQKYNQGIKLSIRTLVARLDPTRMYLVATQTHLLAVIRGQVEDWSAGRLHKAAEILEITENGIAVSDFVAPKVTKRDNESLQQLRAETRAIINHDDDPWHCHYDSKVTGSWVKFSQVGWRHCGFSFLVGQAPNGMFKLAIQEDGNSSRSVLTTLVNGTLNCHGRETKSYISWTVTAEQLRQVVTAIRSF